MPIKEFQKGIQISNRRRNMTKNRKDTEKKVVKGFLREAEQRIVRRKPKIEKKRPETPKSKSKK